MNERNVTVLYVRSDSIYKDLGCDCYDIDRDARTWKGGNPLIAHPPCRAWGRLRYFAKPRHDEKDLAIEAVRLIRLYGGVLEHPASSSLWTVCDMPLPGRRDSFGGFTLSIDQFWFGHKARKKTWLYICGVEPGMIPPYPLRFDALEYCVETMKRSAPGQYILKAITKAEREHTPPDLARWLIDLASRCVGS